MRPYRRKHHSTWRTRRGRGLINEVSEYLKPFLHCTKSIWRLDPPFPLTAKLAVTVVTWFLLFLPLCYFLVPPLAAVFLLNYFSESISLDGCVIYLGELCARTTWPKQIALSLTLFDRLVLFFFLYDYYQIVKCFRGD